MADPENQPLHLLRESRAAQEALGRDLNGKIDALSGKLGAVEENLSQRIKSLQQAINGESVLGRYAAAEVDERLDAIERCLTVLEKS